MAIQVGVRLNYWQILDLARAQASKLADPQGKLSHNDTIAALEMLETLRRALIDTWPT